jgi:hypothetical protein
MSLAIAISSRSISSALCEVFSHQAHCTFAHALSCK